MDESYEEDESYEPIHPNKASEPPPLKRLWVSPPDEDEAGESLPVKKKKKTSVEAAEPTPLKKKKKKAEEVIDDGTGAIKLEETPVLDTYETRQRIRMIVGGIIAAIVVIVGSIILNAVKKSGTPEVRDSEPPSENTRVVVDERSNVEAQARILLDMAKQTDKNGSSVAAQEMLTKLVKNYQNTASGRDAMIALERAKGGRSLFGTDAPEQVSGPKPPTAGTSEATGKNAENTGSAPNVPVVAAPPPFSRPLPPGYRPKYDYPIHPSGWPTRISCDRDGAELVLVPASVFLMGRADGELAERPEHQVAVSTYYIDKHEVTVGMYLRYLKETGRPIEPAKAQVADDLPVVNISAREAKAYCNWALRRLPTEAQWELAARGPDIGKISYWNGELPRKDPEKGPRTMEPVMTLPTDLSPFGAYDMAANAWEWCSDFYESKYYSQFRNLVTDPTGPKEPPADIVFSSVRGGSKGGILTWRRGEKTQSRFPYLGFRGALPVEGSPIAPPAPPAANGPAKGPAGGQIPF